MRKLIGMGCLLGGLSISTASADITVEKAWARASTGPNAALFMTLVNTTNTTDILVETRIEGCDRTELHNHVETAGVFRMVEVPGIEIPARGQADLKPGGHHVMLMGISAPLKNGDILPVTLSFSTHEDITIHVPVKAQAAECGCQK